MSRDSRRGLAIQPAHKVDAAALLEHVVETWHAEAVVAHGERIFPARLPGFVALRQEEIVGHVSHRLDGGRCEITSIDATPSQSGIGSRLLAAAVDAARQAGCQTVWLTTTNDNLDALRFYQQRGFHLRKLRAGAIDRTREELKPELPRTGSYGIPMRDELDVELDLL